MKKILFVLLVAAFVAPAVTMAADKCQEPKSADLKAGTKVVAQWQGDSWWLAKIDSVNKGLYNVTYSDNTKGKNKKKDQVAYYIYSNSGTMPPCFKEGDSVIAQWKGDNWWKATITSIKGDKADVTYSDGEKGTRLLTQMVRDPW